MLFVRNKKQEDVSPVYKGLRINKAFPRWDSVLLCHGDEDAEHGETYIAYIRILVESGEDAVTEEEFLIIFADLMGGYEDVVPADHGKCLRERD